MLPAQDGNSTTASRLLDVAATLFRTKGYAASSTRELANLLGIQNASLYHHIQKKEDLLYALCVDSLERIQQRVGAAIAAEVEPRRRIEALIHSHLSTALQDKDKHATMLIDLRSLAGPRLAHVIQLRGRYEGLVREALAAGQAGGVLRRDVDAKHLTLALLNLLNWSIFWFRDDGELTAEELAEVMAKLFIEGAEVRP